MEPRQVADIVVRLWLIAMTKELTNDRIDAMWPCGQIGSLGHGENTEL